MTEQEAIAKEIANLPPPLLREILDFVQWLKARRGTGSGDAELVAAAQALSEPVFERIWDNPEDAAYDKL